MSAQEEVAQVEQQWLQAYHEGNAEALGALYAADTHYTPPQSPFRLEGKEAIQELHTR